jgi:hypothetical protein
MEKLLVSQELTASKVRKADNLRRGFSEPSSKESRDESSEWDVSLCPSCQPLMDANIELRKVADRKLGSSGASSVGKYAMKGSALQRERDKAPYPMYGLDLRDLSYNSYNKLKVTSSRPPSRPNSRPPSRPTSPDGSESVDDDATDASSREAAFVARFLKKVSKKGELPLVFKNHDKQRSSKDQERDAFDIREEIAVFENKNNNNDEQRRETGFDTILSNALRPRDDDNDDLLDISDYDEDSLLRGFVN